MYPMSVRPTGVCMGVHLVGMHLIGGNEVSCKL
jgi:hypothetical protein